MPGYPGNAGFPEERRIPCTPPLLPFRPAKLTRARSLHGARRFVVKPGVPTAPLTPQHNRAAVSTGAPCQLFTVACPSRCPSALPAPRTDKNSCGHRQPWCHKHPPPPLNPWLLEKPARPIPSAPTTQRRVTPCSNNLSQLPQVTGERQRRQTKSTKSALLNFSFPLCSADKVCTLGQVFWELQKENEAAISTSQKAVLSIPSGLRMGKGQGRRVTSKACPHSSKLLGVNRLASQKGLTNSLHSAPPSCRSC